MTRSPRRRGARGPAGALGAALLGGSLAAAAVLGWAGAAEAARPAPTLSLTARPAAHGAPAIELLARLAEPGGATAGATSASLGGVTISFSLHVQQLSGAPLLVLGSATTDAAGVASLDYEPTWTGRQSLVASATNAAGTTLGSATASFVAAGATHPLAGSAEAVRPDGTIGRVVVGVLLAIVALLWIVLVAVVVRVRRGGTPSPA